MIPVVPAMGFAQKWAGYRFSSREREKERELELEVRGERLELEVRG